MSFDISRVFSNMFAMVKERWLSMIALWATFLGFLFLYGIVVFAVIGGTFTALIGSMAGFDSPAAVGGLGIGFIVLGIVFYIGYFAIVFGQQASMIAAASPLQRLGFGEAFGRGLKGGLTMLGVMILLLIAYFIAGLVFALVVMIVSFMGEIAGILLAVLIIPALIYFVCRFSVIVPVIVVEQVYNPITAINRTWHVTRGNVLGILIVMIAFTVIAAAVFFVPFILFGATMESFALGATAGIATFIFAFLFFVVLSFAIGIFSASLLASLHAEVSDTQAVEFGRTFE